jgi:branched-chain amino acid transport system permease protein
VGRLSSAKTVSLLFFALSGSIPLFANEYVFFVGQLTLIYAILAIGLNILIGYTGQLAFANAALFGIGAYGYGLLVVTLGLPFWLALIGGALAALLVGALIAVPALRLSGVYLALVTLSFAQFTQWVLTHWDEVTYGAGGFRVPAPDLSLLGVSPRIGLFTLIWGTALAVFVCSWNLIHSRYGRAFTAIRDGETVAQSLGINLALYKGLAFGISGLLAGVAGGFHAATINFVAPESFDLVQMVLQFTMVLLGGLGSLVGSVIGAACMMLLLEITRGARDLQEIVFGTILLFFVLFQPGGITALLNRVLPNWEEGLHSRSYPQSTTACLHSKAKRE